MAFDPDGNGAEPVKVFQEAAEKYGYIVAGSDNARNGPAQRSADAFVAMWRDLHARLRIDDRRVYAAGFSGMARFSSLLAQRCKCITGVALSGAGFTPESPSSQSDKFLVFVSIGQFDFNFPEIIHLRDTLNKNRINNEVEFFDGAHQWMPSAIATETLEWFNLQGMQSWILAHDDAFVAAQWAQRLAFARKQEEGGDVYRAQISYSQMVHDFRNLHEVSVAQAAVDRIQQSAAYRRANIAIEDQIKRQSAITDPLSASMSSLLNDNPASEDARHTNSTVSRDQSGDRFQDLKVRLADLHREHAHEKDTQKLAILRRAVGGLFGQVYDTLQELLEKKDYEMAEAFLELGGALVPDRINRLYYQTASTCAKQANRKEALHFLREAVRAGFRDRSELESNTDFSFMKNDPEFKALLNRLGPP